MMFPRAAISRTHLARNTRQTIEQARRGQAILVESYGEEQVAIVDALDYRLLRATAAYRAHPDAPAQEAQAIPQGMSAADLAAISADDPQMGWDRVIAAYLDGHISLGRAAGLLKQSRFELQARFNRLGLPLRLGTPTVAEGEAEYAALMDDN
jgi:hypothetical protein